MWECLGEFPCWVLQELSRRYEEALKASMYTELRVLRMDKRRKWVIFAFGNYAKSFYCETLGLDLEQLVITSNFVI